MAFGTPRFFNQLFNATPAQPEHSEGEKSLAAFAARDRNAPVPPHYMELPDQVNEENLQTLAQLSDTL